MKGSSAPEESANTMGAPNLNPEESPEVESVLNTSQGSLLEVNPEKEGCIPETETGEISVDAEMASDCLLYTSPSPRDGLLSRMPSSA